MHHLLVQRTTAQVHQAEAAVAPQVGIHLHGRVVPLRVVEAVDEAVAVASVEVVAGAVAPREQVEVDHAKI
jgi:hypothetical protein